MWSMWCQCRVTSGKVICVKCSKMMMMMTETVNRTMFLLLSCFCFACIYKPNVSPGIHSNCTVCCFVLVCVWSWTINNLHVNCQKSLKASGCHTGKIPWGSITTLFFSIDSFTHGVNKIRLTSNHPHKIRKWFCRFNNTQKRFISGIQIVRSVPSIRSIQSETHLERQGQISLIEEPTWFKEPDKSSDNTRQWHVSALYIVLTSAQTLSAPKITIGQHSR